MIEIKGNLWNFYNKGHWICITTNGTIRKDGCLVMGRGCALEATKAWSGCAKLLGGLIKETGNIPYMFLDKKIITFPVKHAWHERANLRLIKESARSIKKIVNNWRIKELYIPRPGCGNGKLDWEIVKPELEKIFTDDRFIIISFPGEK